jgi:hypothetical protein
LSVSWLLANPAITSVIVGTSLVERLMDMLAAADYKLNDALETKQDEASLEFRRGRRNGIRRELHLPTLKVRPESAIDQWAVV